MEDFQNNLKIEDRGASLDLDYDVSISGEYIYQSTQGASFDVWKAGRKRERRESERRDGNGGESRNCWRGYCDRREREGR